MKTTAAEGSAMPSARQADSDALPSSTFCALPWLHLFADQRGVLYPCCRVTGLGLPNVDAEGTPLRIDGDLEAAWNSEYMRSIRRDMLAGRRPQACQRCFRYEDLGVWSQRNISNRNFAAELPRLSEEAAADGSAAFDIRSLDLYPGNLCNLRCRMCFPSASKALIREWAECNGLSLDDDYLVEARNLDWFEDQAFWRRLGDLMPRLERLHFGGGEPLLVSQIFRFLARLVESGDAGHITLSFVTNLSMRLPPEIFELWPAFKEVRVTASVDGFGPVNSYIRYPSSWQRLDANLKLLDRRADELKCRVLGFNTTVQIYNVLSLTDLFEYTLSSFERFEPYPNLILLEAPTCFSVQLLPPKLKELAVQRLRDFMRRHDGCWPTRSGVADREGFLRNLEGLIDHVMAIDRSDELPEFVRQNGVFDRSRDQTLADVVPELGCLVDGTW